MCYLFISYICFFRVKENIRNNPGSKMEVIYEQLKSTEFSRVAEVLESYPFVFSAQITDNWTTMTKEEQEKTFLFFWSLSMTNVETAPVQYTQLLLVCFNNCIFYHQQENKYLYETPKNTVEIGFFVKEIWLDL